mmetsp:Transcript_13535/g.24143  ORF Transcript_13535/g.24143 Transcript_13535/m.24143 type:complete len:105 (+) Transcript_13535:250-564(+)
MTDGMYESAYKGPMPEENNGSLCHNCQETERVCRVLFTAPITATEVTAIPEVTCGGAWHALPVQLQVDLADQAVGLTPIARSTLLPLSVPAMRFLALWTRVLPQ